MATGMFSGGAAFGVFPQMQPRRRFQDPVGAANVPLDVTRGRFAGLAGLLPDALNFMGRSPMPTEMFGETQYEPTQQLPYGSEYYLQNLPLKPTSRIGEVAGQAGAFVPLNPMPAARAVAAGAKALGPTAVGMGERYLQSRGLMPGVVEGESIGMLGGPIKPQAPVSELGFYSAAEQAALNLPRKSGTGESFLNDLMKGQDVKKDELSWMGLDDYLKGKPNVTRQEVQDFIASNRVDVRERQLGGILSPELQVTRDALNNKYKVLVDNIADAKSQFEEGKISYAELRNTVSTNKVQTEALDSQINEINKTITPTKYQQYQLPGGENYREILLTLPQKKNQFPDFEQWLTNRYGGSEVPEGVRQAARKEYERQSSGLGISGGYQSGHFNEPNILAHMRVNDRVDADGKKMLLIEEIQSDWHQAGREKGYKTGKERDPAQVEKELNITTQKRSRLLEEAAALPDSEMTKFKAMNEEIKALGEQATKLNEEWTDLLMEPTRVPDAPFKDTWHQLALKRALKYAADNGYDRVGLTTGRQQVDRYTNEIRQNVDEIQFQTGQKLTDIEAAELKALRQKTFRDMTGTERAKFDVLSSQEGSSIRPDEIKIKAYKGGSNTFDGKVKNGKFIEGPAQGKTVEEVLGKSMAKKIAEQRTGTIKGDDLTIGGEGMKAYYDEIYPAFLAKQGKKYNAKTGETRIKTGNAYAQTKGIPAEQSIRYIDISPEMRGGVKKGQPLFTAAPIGGIGLGAGTQDNEMPEAVRQYMADPRYSDPFADTTR